MSDTKLSQRQWVLRWLRERGPLTPKQAYEGKGIMRLSGRIYELRQEGHDIETEKKNGNGHAIYHLNEEED